LNFRAHQSRLDDFLKDHPQMPECGGLGSNWQEEIGWQQKIYFPSKKLAIDAPSNSFLSPVVKHVFTYAHPHPISLPSIYCPAAAAAVQH
jgi:hypothetical protein